MIVERIRADEDVALYCHQTYSKEPITEACTYKFLLRHPRLEDHFALSVILML